jgi:hypothetical protein
MTLQLLHSEFPYIFEDNFLFFFICVKNSKDCSLFPDVYHQRSGERDSEELGPKAPAKSMTNVLPTLRPGK